MNVGLRGIPNGMSKTVVSWFHVVRPLRTTKGPGKPLGSTVVSWFDVVLSLSTFSRDIFYQLETNKHNAASTIDTTTIWATTTTISGDLLPPGCLKLLTQHNIVVNFDSHSIVILVVLGCLSRSQAVSLERAATCHLSTGPL
jgi:hypothetical protein